MLANIPGTELRVPMEIERLPTVFRGCMFDDGWEFDAPCILYFPYRRYGIGSNTFKLDEMIYDLCFDIAEEIPIRKGFGKYTLEEFLSRGWSPRGFAKRLRAWHVVFEVRWYRDDYGHLCVEIVDRRETWGPPR